jgi:transcriptional regulator with XRE-family HTH domain
MGAASNKPFRRGDIALVRIKSPAGLILEHECRVKEMVGANDVAIVFYGRDRVVSLKDCRRHPADESPALDPEQVPLAPTLVKVPPKAQSKQPLSATIGESVSKKIQPPAHFDAKATEEDPRDICVLLRGARNSRNITLELMAQMLRVEKEELIAFETRTTMPSDDVVLRLADVLNLPLDPLIAGLEHSKQKDAKVRAQREAAEKEAQAKVAAAREAKERLDEQERARKAASAPKFPSVAKSGLSFEDFGERLMDLAPVPIDKLRRKQWYSAARILFELEN